MCMPLHHSSKHLIVSNIDQNLFQIIMTINLIYMGELLNIQKNVCF